MPLTGPPNRGSIMIETDGTVYCDGFPHYYGCDETIKPARPWRGEGRKKSRWLVNHATDDIWGTPTVPLFLLHFCPSCAEIVLRQIAKDKS